MKMRKIISCTLLICLLASVFAITVSANDRGPNIIPANATAETNGTHTDTATQSWAPESVLDDTTDANGNFIYAWNGRQGDYFYSPATLTIDLQSALTFNSMMVVERRSRTGDFILDVSTDGNTWTTVADGHGLGGTRVEGDNNAGIEDQNEHFIDFDTVTARYVRLTMEYHFGIGAPPSIWRIELFNAGGAAAPPPVVVTPEVATPTPTAEPVAPTVTPTAAPQTNDNIIILAGVSIIALAGAVVIRKRRMSVK